MRRCRERGALLALRPQQRPSILFDDPRRPFSRRTQFGQGLNYFQVDLQSSVQPRGGDAVSDSGTTGVSSGQLAKTGIPPSVPRRPTHSRRVALRPARQHVEPVVTTAASPVETSPPRFPINWPHGLRQGIRARQRQHERSSPVSEHGVEVRMYHGRRSFRQSSRISERKNQPTDAISLTAIAQRLSGQRNQYRDHQDGTWLSIAR